MRKKRQRLTVVLELNTETFCTDYRKGHSGPTCLPRNDYSKDLWGGTDLLCSVTHSGQQSKQNTGNWTTGETLALGPSRRLHNPQQFDHCHSDKIGEKHLKGQQRCQPRPSKTSESYPQQKGEATIVFLFIRYNLLTKQTTVVSNRRDAWTMSLL